MEEPKPGLNLEIPIVTTSLISIATELGGLDKISWITTAWMLGYAGVLVLSAKVSDIFGWEPCLLVGVGLFIVFLAAFGVAQTMEQFVPSGVVAALSLIMLLMSLQRTYLRVDILGAILLLAATRLLVTAHDEANEQFTWRSAFTITLLIVSGLYE
ncbi:uncharacterized protein BO66DRAFT_440994 [Aspergillus aculeatinus CBS 121060]|uniref:Uncharacterized protein n=1 Tax=Aspergillus aculeatinus CBS 121060 TaxID=1448322 RepID=A0ACD1H1S6_9EURO|nr:hypothetical protein BO66DRAFT_440994 [Aspergillus aculeatinus CBS 121060]RAH67537.1 hypothetical protein BO66DRAFT_440994 [Aspergillus aculeatinus CBS 121060]